MTFKSIDLQMSVPRTQEFSGKHGQAIHKPVVDQNMLAAQTTKQTDLLRGKNTAVEQSNGAHIRNDQERQQGNAYQKARRKPLETAPEDHVEEHPPTHPFKGHRVDIKL
ncbi:hypothetical protein [Paenibacillus sp. LHD-38]|uniref:hypothetical protein n=1 Tax=Paenibacillus sp. LHD-38 TaxID=3072143 RepID=UPI00280E3293|nr:hypothetical protein [Paenibacillus sp. LHD-38]MDQ8733332.1 hypothetical protein [Paenibacillus sp. LHD-38]